MIDGVKDYRTREQRMGVVKYTAIEIIVHILYWTFIFAVIVVGLIIGRAICSYLTYDPTAPTYGPMIGT